MFDTQEMRAPGLPADTAPALALPPGGQQVHLLDRLNAVFKHRRVAAAAFLLVLGAMMLQSYSTIPTYRTFAQVEISDERTSAAGSLATGEPSYEEVDLYKTTQYQVIKGREVGRRVVKKLNLIEHPLFNGGAPKPKDPLTRLRQARTDVSTWVRSLISKPADAPPKPAAVDENAIIAAVMGSVQVTPVPDTLLVNIFYTHHDPEFAALAVNAIAEEYTAQNLAKRLESTQNTMAWIDKELKDAEASSAEFEQKLSDYRRDNDAQSLEERSNTVISRLNEMNARLLGAQSTAQAALNQWNQVAKADPKEDSADNITAIGSDAEVVKARGELAKLVAEHAQLGTKYAAQHTEMKRVQLNIAVAEDALVAARARVKEKYRSAYESARIAESQLAQSFSSQTASVSDLDLKAVEYNKLKRQAEVSRDAHKELLIERQKHAMAANSQVNNVRVVDQADVPKTPITPDTRKDLITAILLGLTLALGLAFGLEYLDDSVKTPDDVTKRLGLPLLGLVPAVRGERVPILSETVPHDFGEAFRSLRTSLVFTTGGEATRVIAVTSSQPLEGKTTTACNLAMALALGGSRVLLIDADMRRPGLHKTIGLQNSLGLSHLLVGQSRVREVVQRTREPNLFVITAGRTPPNPSELLASERMDHLLANLAKGPFDWVVIDTPPVLAVTDAVIIGQKVGTVVFVIGSEMTRRVHAEHALETLQSVRIRSIGAVLNRVDFDRNKYYYARYYGYQYKSYYGQNNPPPA
jgi:succinoglycan biosynthesis transport protein ExoP